MNLFSRHVKGLFDFSGRENRQPFWLWVLITYGVQMTLSMIAMFLGMAIYTQKMQPLTETDPAFLDAHPEIAQKLILDAMAPMFQAVMIMAVVSALLFAVSLAAATVRRLHDTNRTGWWAAPYYMFVVVMPIVQAVIMSRFFKTMGTFRPGMSPEEANAAFVPFFQVWAVLMVSGLIGLLLTIMLVVFCCLPGTVGPNRFGEDPLPRPEVKPFI